MQRLHLQAHACLNEGSLTSCVLERGDCPFDFVSNRALLQNPAQTGAECLEAASVQNIPIGKCMHERDNSCAVSAAACTIADDFVANDPECTIAGSPGNPTLYGECSVKRGGEFHDYYCTYSHDICTEQGVNPNVYYISGLAPVGIQDVCRCSDARVGSCDYGNGEYLCAVSQASCDSSGIYRNMEYMHSNNFGFECYACEVGGVPNFPPSSPSFVPPPPIPVEPTAAPTPSLRLTPAPFTSPEAPPTAQERPSSSSPASSLSSEDKNSAVIAASVVVAAVVVAALSMIAWFVHRRKQKAKSFASGTQNSNIDAVVDDGQPEKVDGDFDDVDSLKSENKIK